MVIPAMAEREHLPATLASLAECCAGGPARSLVVVVVNQSAGAAPDIVQNNADTLAWLGRYGPGIVPDLGWIDASSAGCELPSKSGVGLARKIGADSALSLLNDISGRSPGDVIIAHLDADTTVEPDYLRVLAGLPGGRCAFVLNFCHQVSDVPVRQRAIDLYELYMRYLVAGLRGAGSPYGFHALGSAMASTVDAYVAAGGIAGKRQAGEDFYFLQECAKVGTVETVPTTTVTPSCRCSFRVPFGTGPRISQITSAGGTLAVPAPEAFAELGILLQVYRQACDRRERELIPLIPEELHPHVKGIRLEEVWGKLRSRCRSAQMLLREMHRWFDGLATIRFIRQRGERDRAPVAVEEAWQAVTGWVCEADGGGARSLLSEARRLQRVPDCRGLLAIPGPRNMLASGQS